MVVPVAISTAISGTERPIGRPGRDGLVRRFGRDKEAAIPILQAIQTHYRYLPDEALRHVCEQTEITPAQIAGTSSFYSQFRRSPVGRHVVRVCHGTACHVAGAEQITEELRRHLDIPAGEDTDDQRLFTLDKVACVGCCSLAPVMMIEEETAGGSTPATARQALDAVAKRDMSTPAPVEFRVGLASCGVANGARPVHEALEAAVREAGHGVARAVGCGGMCHREPLVEVVDDERPPRRLHPRHPGGGPGPRPSPPAAEGPPHPRPVAGRGARRRRQRPVRPRHARRRVRGRLRRRASCSRTAAASIR